MSRQIEPFSYAPSTPRGYVCSRCCAHGCKLWRQYQTFLEHVELLCGSCALADQGKRGPIDEEGAISDGESPLGRRTSAIGWLVPAVPTEDGETFWGYTSTPTDGWAWWRRLPTDPRCEPDGPRRPPNRVERVARIVDRSASRAIQAANRMVEAVLSRGGKT